MGTLYKIMSSQEWKNAVRRGVYEGSEVDRRDGFIHPMIPGVADDEMSRLGKRLLAETISAARALDAQHMFIDTSTRPDYAPARGEGYAMILTPWILSSNQALIPLMASRRHMRPSASKRAHIPPLLMRRTNEDAG